MSEFMQYVQKFNPKKHPLGWHTAYAYALKVEAGDADVIREKWGTPEAQVGDYILLLPKGEVNVMVGEEFDKLFPTPQKIIMGQPIPSQDGWF